MGDGAGTLMADLYRRLSGNFFLGDCMGDLRGRLLVRDL